MNKPELPKSPALLVLDCVYELFSAFVMWRKKNDCLLYTSDAADE